MTVPLSSSQSSDPRPPPRWSYRKLIVLETPLLALTGMTCRDFARISVTRLDRSLTLSETLRYQVHGVLCALCRGFSGQFDQINALIREAAAEASTLVESTGNEPAINRIQQQVKARIGHTE